MHIVIVGIGGVGGYFGGKIAQSGQKVTMIARGQHLAAIRAKGLQVRSIEGDFTVHPHHVTDTIADVVPADLLFICTKSWQVAEAAASVRSLVHQDTIVIPLQNGADNAERIATIVPTENVIGGLCKLYSKIEAPGVISHFGYTPEIIVGALEASQKERLSVVQEVLTLAGIKHHVSDTIQIAIWSKFMFIATVSGLGALTRATIGAMYASPVLQKMLRETATEMHAVAIARGVPLPDTLVDRTLAFIAKQPYEATASTQRDIMEGRPSELENFNGFIVQEGKKLGIPTPMNELIYHCLLPMETKARK